MSMLSTASDYLKDVSVLRRLLFAASFFPRGSPNYWGNVVEFATLGRVQNNSISLEIASALVDNIQTFDRRAFETDESLFKEICSWKPTSLGTLHKKPIGIVLISATTVCVLCGNTLAVRRDRPASLIIYDHASGPLPATHYHKICSRKTCPLTGQYYGYYTVCRDEHSQTFFDSDWISLPYFLSSSLTGFSMNTVKKFDGDILLGQLSYKQIADIFNYFHFHQLETTRELALIQERVMLDRRRVEAAHLQFAVLKVASWYGFQLNKLELHQDADTTIAKQLKEYHGCFMTHYARNHCDNKDCQRTLVLDGNMKNHRDVCAAKEAGFATYDGFPCTVKTGCTSTPQLKSRYCSAHTPTVICSADDVTTEQCDSQTSKQHQLAFIVEKKTTRQNVFYKVARIGDATANCHWEPECNLPLHLIEEFNNGIEREVVEDVYTSGGRSLHTIMSKAVPHQKRKKCQTESIQRPNEEEHDEDTTAIVCKTLKDKVKLNYCTAGVLAGIWSCGKIVIVSELYGAESLTQVYAALHTFIAENTVILNELDTICYDDGCHLKKYSQKRQALTATAKKIANYSIVVDKMHFRGHTDLWCKENCNPYKLEHLNNIDTEVCEQTFSWLSRYSRITRHMNAHHFLFYILYLCDLHNRSNISH